MANSDDRRGQPSSKSRHCCCNIRVASYVIGVLELLSVLYILAQHSIRSIIADVQQTDQSDQKSSQSSGSSSGGSAVSSAVMTSTKRWLGPGATTPLVTWAVCETLFLGLMFYGIARNRPWLLIPQLFLQIITIIVCMILNVLMVCVLAWHPNIVEIWYFLTSTVIFALLYEYGLVIMIRCYRYLRDRAAMEHQTTSIFVLPTRGANGELIMASTNEAIVESRMYSDLPPEYAQAIEMMTVEDSRKLGPPATPISSSAPVPAPDSSSTVVRTISETESESESKPEAANSTSDLRHEIEPEVKDEPRMDELPPPTYEEARELQKARCSVSGSTTTDS